jgi:hypothetical protein
MNNKQKVITFVILALLVISPIFSGVALAYTRDLSNVPYYQQEQSNYCGPATAQMWIKYEDGDYYSQTTLWNYIQDHLTEPDYWNTDPDSLEATLDHYIPANAWYFDSSYSNADSGLNDVVYYLDKYVEPQSSLVYNGDHWMLVRGVYSSVAPATNPSYTVCGIYVNDPDPSGVGEDHYFTASTWKSSYFTANQYGTKWNGKYVNVVCPEHGSDEGPGNGMAGLEKSYHADRAEQAVQIAYERYIAHNLTKNQRFAEHFNGSVAGVPIMVKSLSPDFSNYYLVPFKIDGKTSTVVIVEVGGGKMRFAGASYASEHLDEYPEISEEEATQIAEDYAGHNLGHPLLVWKPCVQSWSPYHPFWKFHDGSTTLYIATADGAIYTELTRPEKGGS